MQTRIQKWGNSLAIRIPRAFATEVNLQHNTPVDISLLEDKIIIKPIAEPELTLEELLAGIKEENLHGEVDTGSAAGNEIW
jgi:antitoxin MazE